MKVVFEQYDALPCCAKTFIINDIEADIDDFGFSETSNHVWDDFGFEDLDRWGCRDRVWYTWLKDGEGESWEPVLKKYGINKEELWEITDMLESLLSIGNCGWCI